MYSNIAIYTYEVDPFYTDPNKEMSIAAIVNHIQIAASEHADSCGWGFDKLSESETRWVLARLAVEMNTYPQLYDTLVVETWVEDITRLFSIRNFEFKNQNGETLGYACSIWSAINMETRKSIDLTSLSGDIMSYKSDKPCPINRPVKPLSIADTSFLDLPIRYSDIDVNRHVNSTRYIEHLLDLFPLDFHDKYMINRFEIAYQNEARFGDTLELHKKELEPLKYAFEIKKNNLETACKAQIKFKPKQSTN